MIKQEIAEIQFVDLQEQYRRLKQAIDGNIQRVLDHGQFIMGPEVAEVERRLCEYVGVDYCVSCASGTDALSLALMALGVGPGDEVITTPFTFIASSEVIALVGAKPIFVDIDPRTFNIDPGQIECAITGRTKAIIPVSLFGQCARMDSINEIAGRHNLPVVEDAAQSFGAQYRGRRSGALSTVGCTSFFPSKPLGCYGDGGACFTNDPKLAKLMQQIRVHGQDRRYHHAVIGLNGRLDTIQAAILLAKLKAFPDELESRRRIATTYTERLEGILHTPYIEPDHQSAFAQYSVLADSRDQLRSLLQDRGIPTAVHYPLPLHLQPAFAGLGLQKGAYPQSEKIAARVMSLPMHPYLSDSQVEFICSAIKEGVGKCS